MGNNEEIIYLQNLSKKELYSILDNFFLNADYTINEVTCFDHKRKYLLSKNSKNLTVTVLLKNISDCGWKNRKNIKRIQVMKLQGSLKTKINEYFLLLGLTKVDDKFIIVAWNPLKYVYHEKNRSAYVYDNTLFEAKKIGFYHIVQNGEKILACDIDNFTKLLDMYFDYSYVEEI